MKILILSALMAAASLTAAAQTQVIAHRGHWKPAGSAQNGIVSLQKADSIGCYGSEFDVWLVADDELVAYHDNTFNGAWTEESTSAQFQAATLANGERTPLLSEFLTAAKACTTRLILELKPHRAAERETAAVEKIVAMIDSMGLADRTEYISFSIHACKEFVRLAPAGTPVYYLNGDLPPKELKALGLAGMDYPYPVVFDHPDWIAESHALGMKVNSWTVDDTEAMRRLIDLKVDFITTNNPEDLQRVLRGE